MHHEIKVCRKITEFENKLWTRLSRCKNGPKLGSSRGSFPLKEGEEM